MTSAEVFLAAEGVVPGCRWGATRKAAFLTALNRWPEESAALMERHGISAEELVQWRTGVAQAGQAGLRVCYLDDRRRDRLDAAASQPHRDHSA